MLTGLRPKPNTDLYFPIITIDGIDYKSIISFTLTDIYHIYNIDHDRAKKLIIE